MPRTRGTSSTTGYPVIISRPSCLKGQGLYLKSSPSPCGRDTQLNDASAARLLPRGDGLRVCVLLLLPHCWSSLSGSVTSPLLTGQADECCKLFPISSLYHGKLEHRSRDVVSAVERKACKLVITLHGKIDVCCLIYSKLIAMRSFRRSFVHRVRKLAHPGFCA